MDQPEVSSVLQAVPQPAPHEHGELLRRFCQMRTALPTASAPPVGSLALSESVAAAAYQAGLQLAAQRERDRWEPATIQKREQISQEFAAFLQCLPASWGRSIHNCGPLDILAFVELSWVHKHQGSWLPNGSKVASPSGHSGMLSHLSTMFRLIGRCGPWNPLTNEGNPIESEIISSHRAAYHAGMLKRGYQEGSAIPITLDDHRSLIRALDLEIARADSPVKQLDLSCTALACCYLWEGGQRGKEVGRLELQDLTLPGGESALPALLLCQQPPAELVILPAGTKTIRGRGQAIVVLQSLPPEAVQFCFVRRLRSFLLSSLALQQPVQQFLFRPQCQGGGRFLEKAMSSSRPLNPLLLPDLFSLLPSTLVSQSPSDLHLVPKLHLVPGCLQHRITSALQRHGLYHGQSVHSYRRGSLQALHYDQLLPKEDVGRHAQIKTPAVVELYLDKSRHLARQKRRRCMDGDSLPDVQF